MKYLNRFNESKIYFDYTWEEFDPEDLGITRIGTGSIVAEAVWKKKLSKPGFNCLVRKQESTNMGMNKSIVYNFYLEEPGTLNFMDNLLHPYYHNILKSDNPLNIAFRICEDQLDWYENKEKFPTEEDINKNIFVFTDEGFELFGDIKYGYEYKLSDESCYDLVTWQYQRFNSVFTCSFILTPLGEIGKDFFSRSKIEDLNDEFLYMLDIKDDFYIKYFIDSRGLVISIRRR